MRDICWCPRCEYPAFLVDGEHGRLALVLPYSETNPKQTSYLLPPASCLLPPTSYLLPRTHWPLLDSLIWQCGKCSFSFCKECSRPWHGLAPCANLATRWRNAGESEREILRQKYGDRVVEEIESSEWMLANCQVRSLC